MSLPSNQCCYLCKFHNVYWDGSDFAGCECRAWDERELLAKHHECSRGASYSASRTSGTNCPRFALHPPEEYEG